MTDRPEKPRNPDPAAERAARKHRLAQALRDNLRRRKDQARAKADSGEVAASRTDPAAPSSGGNDRDPGPRSG